MFQVSLFIESDSENEVSVIINEVMSELSELVSDYHILSSEQYWKIDTWYKVEINADTVTPITPDTADNLLKKMCNIWIWDNNKSSAHTNDKKDDVIFLQPKIKFITCWFEDLE